MFVVQTGLNFGGRNSNRDKEKIRIFILVLFVLLSTYNFYPTRPLLFSLGGFLSFGVAGGLSKSR